MDVSLMVVFAVDIGFRLITAPSALVKFLCRHPLLVLHDGRVVSSWFRTGALPPDNEDLVVVDVHNDRAGRGEGATARNVLPEIAVFDERGEELIYRHKPYVGPVDLSPAGEEYTIAIARKVRSVDEIIVGERRLRPGRYRVTVTLRGNNVKPMSREYLLRNLGGGAIPRLD